MEEEEEGPDMEILDGPPPVFMAPRKKRAIKVKEKLDDSFLRRSKSFSKKLEGFKDVESAKKFKETVADVGEPVPLAMIPPPGKNVAPHPPREILEGIGQGFLQIQFETVSLHSWRKMI